MVENQKLNDKLSCDGGERVVKVREVAGMKKENIMNQKEQEELEREQKRKERQQERLQLDCQRQLEKDMATIRNAHGKGACGALRGLAPAALHTPKKSSRGFLV